MMNLPHLSFLRSFEAAARHMSFTGASEELNCTQAAVSNHVRSLEEFIGRPLFVRHPRSLSLTDVGAAYLPSVRHALEEIDVATQSLVAQPHKREVVISCPVSLAANWLPQVIQGFSQSHSDVDFTLHGTIWNDVEENVSDISILVLHRDEITASMIPLWHERLTLVCAPDYRIQGEMLRQPAQLAQANLIQILGRLEYWELVAQALGLDGLEPMSSLRCGSTNLALELAASGQGCVAVPISLAQIFVDRGLLVEPFEISVPSPWTYCLRVASKSATPTVKLFRDWLEQVAKDQMAE